MYRTGSTPTVMSRPLRHIPDRIYHPRTLPRRTLLFDHARTEAAGAGAATGAAAGAAAPVGAAALAIAIRDAALDLKGECAG